MIVHYIRVIKTPKTHDAMHVKPEKISITSPRKASIGTIKPKLIPMSVILITCEILFISYITI